MDLSPIGRAALRAREGEELTAYKDSAGVWTIGVGITTASGLITVTPGLTITKAQSDALFAKAVERYVAPVRDALKRPITQEQFDALVSIAFNIGPAGFRGSTFLRRLNAGDVEGAAAAIMLWVKPAEITSRRRAERDQFLTPYAKALPKARDTDRRSVAPPPDAPVTAPPPVATPSTAPAKPAPSGGLSSAPSPAPKPASGRLARALAWLRTALAA